MLVRVKRWDRKAYRRSVRARRVRLPCPRCDLMIRKPSFEVTGQAARHRRARPEVECPKCQEGRASCARQYRVLLVWLQTSMAGLPQKPEKAG